jgi:hypothetical protein
MRMMSTMNLPKWRTVTQMSTMTIIYSNRKWLARPITHKSSSKSSRRSNPKILLKMVKIAMLTEVVSSTKLEEDS